MIASRKHNFIFIKTKKTAGTSIELALGPHCGPDDIVSPIGAPHDIRRFAEDGVLARNFASKEIEKRYRKAVHKGNPKLLKMILEDKRLQRLGAHSRPHEIKAWLGEFWDTAYRFTVDRHPYEKAVSLAAMVRKDLEEVVFSYSGLVGRAWYFENGRLIVDRVIKYDRLAEEFGEVLAHLGLPNIDLPFARQVERDRSPAREQLTAAQRAFIYEKCAPEFEMFGWER